MKLRKETSVAMNKFRFESDSADASHHELLASICGVVKAREE